MTTFNLSGDDKMRCRLCDSSCETDTCEGCLFIQNHSEVKRDEQDFAFWLAVEIEAMEQAADRTLFRRNADDLKKGICKKNRKLKR
jgi:hypothetical protein